MNGSDGPGPLLALLLVPVVIAAMLGLVALLVLAVAVVVAVWLAGYAAVHLLLWLDETRRCRQGPEPLDVAARIEVLEHDLLDGPLFHDGCRWCLMERAYDADHSTDDRTLMLGVWLSRRPVRQT